jgi:hypothetical protein
VLWRTNKYQFFSHVSGTGSVCRLKMGVDSVTVGFKNIAE